MVEINQMAHFVNNHLSDAVYIELYQLQIEADVAFSGATPPPWAHIPNAYFGWRHVIFAEFLNYWREKLAKNNFGTIFVPFYYLAFR